MAGPVRAAKMLGQTRYRDRGGEAWRVDLLDAGRVEETGARRLQPRGVGRFLPGVGGEILARPELLGIHEDRGDATVAFGKRALDERQMPFMKRAHGGNEADAEPGAAPGTDLGAKIGRHAQNGDRRGLARRAHGSAMLRAAVLVP